MQLSRLGLLNVSLCLLPLLFSGLGRAADAAQARTDVDAKDSVGRTALMRASERGDTATVKALIRTGANVNVESTAGWTALQAAAQGDHVESVRALMQGGADVNVKDARHGRTALIWSAEAGRTAVAEALIKGDADVNIADATGRTALMYASYRGHIEIVQALVKAGAKVNEKTNDGTSTLMLAAWACHEDIVRDLMKAGATVGPQEWRRKRPPQFDDFPVNKVYKGPTATVDLHSNPDARTYRTQLREGAKHKANFAGRYIVVDWGCGSNCQVYTLIDAVTGRVFNGSGAERGADFRLDSSLFIADPASGGVAYADDPVSSLPVRYLEWKDDKFTLLYEEACSVSANRQKCGCEDVRELLFRASPK